MRPRIEVEDDALALRVGLDGLRDLGIEREGLVAVARHERLVDVARHALHGRAGLDVERIEAVERAGKAERQRAAFRRARIGVGQVGEVRRQFRHAMHGDAMGTNEPGCRRRFACDDSASGQEPGQRDLEEVPTAESQIVHVRGLNESCGGLVDRPRQVETGCRGKSIHKVLIWWADFPGARDPSVWVGPREADRRRLLVASYSTRVMTGSLHKSDAGTSRVDSSSKLPLMLNTQPLLAGRATVIFCPAASSLATTVGSVPALAPAG